MAGLGPAIHVFPTVGDMKSWMAGTWPAMTGKCRRKCANGCVAGTEMKNRLVTVGLFGAALAAPGSLRARQEAADQTPLQHFGKSVRGVPLSAAVKARKLVFVSGTPGFDAAGKLAVGDFPAEMRQAMDNVTGVLKSAGTGWEHVVKVNVILVRQQDFAEMNRMYASYFPDGRCPARTTTVVSALPQPDFLLEIECEAGICRPPPSVSQVQLSFYWDDILLER
jgi:2-iminobutanoate/2-iminopropanoate deaminase